MKRGLLATICLACAGLTGCSEADQKAFGELFAQSLAAATQQTTAQQTATPKSTTLISPNVPNPCCAELSPNVLAAIQSDSREVKFLATGLAKNSPGPYNIGQICMIWYGLAYSWSYVNDPRGIEYVAKAEDSARLLAGDCDDFAVLMASMIESVGGSARLIGAYRQNAAHMFAEVYIGHTQQEANLAANYIGSLDQLRQYGAKQLHYRTDKDGCWLNLDWSAGYPGGPYFQSENEVIIYPDGRCECR
jgi:hypothetical protein